MVMTDPVADFLTRIRNGNMVMHETVEAPSSKIKVSIAEIMKEEGYIKDYEYIQDGKQGIIRVYLKYGPNKEKVITGIKRISKPGLRVYVKKDEIPKVLGGARNCSNFYLQRIDDRQEGTQNRTWRRQYARNKSKSQAGQNPTAIGLPIQQFSQQIIYGCCSCQSQQRKQQS
jgi:small subunit ribosomal protein S8